VQSQITKFSTFLGRLDSFLEFAVIEVGYQAVEMFLPSTRTGFNCRRKNGKQSLGAEASFWMPANAIVASVALAVRTKQSRVSR
jgi:hypothetical protein